LQQGGKKLLVTFDQTRFARRLAELAELDHQVLRPDGLLLQSLDKLQSTNEPKPLSFNVRGSRTTSMLRVKPSNPGLMKLSRLTQEPVR
jgi:hypothetical protein